MLEMPDMCKCTAHLQVAAVQQVCVVLSDVLR